MSWTVRREGRGFFFLLGLDRSASCELLVSSIQIFPHENPKTRKKILTIPTDTDRVRVRVSGEMTVCMQTSTVS